MHTHHTHPNRAEPRKRNIPKVSIRHGDAGISPHSQKESGHQAKKSDEWLQNGVMHEGVTECWRNRVGGEPLWRLPKDLAYSFQRVEGQNTGLNWRLPQITQRDVVSSRWFDYSISSTRDKPRVETFAGAAR